MTELMTELELKTVASASKKLLNLSIRWRFVRRVSRDNERPEGGGYDKAADILADSEINRGISSRRARNLCSSRNPERDRRPVEPTPWLDSGGRVRSITTCHAGGFV